MRKLVVRWMSVACCAALAAGCSKGSRPAATARGAATSGTAPARPIAEINPGTARVGSNPHGFIASGSRAFFAADDGSSGYELWTTRGDVSGAATLVADLRPGGASSLPADSRVEGVAFGGGVLFAADDGSRGSELWFSDGATARLVRDIVPGTGPSSPRNFAMAGGRAFFVATTPAEGAELWVTNGTGAGTRLVADVMAGEVSSNPTSLTALGASTLVFVATDASGTHLWTTSTGTLATNLLTDVPTDPADLLVFRDRLYFSAVGTGGRELWASDGTGSGTAPLGTPAAASEPSSPTPLGATLYFLAGPPAARDVWGYDTLSSGFTRLTGTNGRPSGATGLAVAGGRLVASLACVAASGCTGTAAGRELYAWTGSAWELLADISGGAFGSDPSMLTSVGDLLYFGATSTGAATLWRTDGTPTGTVQIRPGLGVTEIAAFSGRAIFAGDDAPTGGLDGPEPWITDADGSDHAMEVRNIRGNVGSSSPASLTVWNGRLYFSADDGASGRELWSVDPISSIASIVTDEIEIGGSSDPRDLVALPDRLLFTAFRSAQGRELRALPAGADPTLLVTDLYPGSIGAIETPGWLTRVGDTVLFAANDGGGAGRELWRTDLAGTSLVRNICPGSASSEITGAVAIGSSVWFSAIDGDPLNPFAKAYRSDGTPGGTRPLDRYPLDNVDGDRIYAPTWFAPFGEGVAFAAVRDGYGPVVWISDAIGLRPIQSFTDVGGAADPVAFATVAATGYFGARDVQNGNGYALWTTDGFDPATRVKRVGTQPGGGRLSSALSFGGKYWFVGNDDVNGDELWTSDGTEAGTRMLVDVFPGSPSGLDGSTLFPLPGRGHVLFAADDGISGRELWISDGTALGTRLLHDIWPGPSSSNPADLTALGDLVFFTADDGTSGRELWVIDTAAGALDLTPPVPVCAPQVFEATGPAGAEPVLAITASDAASYPIGFSFVPASGATFAVGETVVTATATDAAGNRAQCTFTVTVQDTTAPTLSCPAELPVEATSDLGAAVSFVGTTAAAATDLVTLVPTVAYAPRSGAVFPLGPGMSERATPVTVTAMDAAFNSTTCTFLVRVADRTAPQVTCPPDVSVEAHDPTGATTGWGSATATDAVSGASSIAISFDATPLASVFPLGTSTVHAFARDEAGNVGSCGFAVRVVDTTAPTISCPAPLTLEATDFVGAPASLAATASDAVSTSPSIGYGVGVDPVGLGTFWNGQPFADHFPYGTTTVRARAWDGFNFSSTCEVAVTVQDTTRPVITCPASFVREAASASTTLVALAGEASATDVATASPTIEYAILAGTVSASDWPAPLGTTTVTATATDRAHNTASCSFPVAIVDRTPPVLHCPADLAVEAEGAAGTVVAFAGATVATATDLVTASPALSYAPASGELFPVALGGAPQVTAVTVTARDDAQNTSTCSFNVTVADTLPPTPACPADLTVEATGPEGATVLSWPDATGVDTVTPAAQITSGDGLVSFAPARGSTFPILPGPDPTATPVTATVRDAAGNASTCTFQVLVRDTTRPTITCPTALPSLEATGNGRARVTFAATATDAVTPAPTVTYDRDPDQLFPVGVTTILATAVDAAANSSSCSFQVTVVDTTPPVITCPAERRVPGNGGVPVYFPAPTVSDLGTPDLLAPDDPLALRISSTRRSGDVFPVGSTVVTFTATDASGNSSSCDMTVFVHPTPFEGGGGGCATGSGGALALLGLVAAVLRRRAPRRRP